MNTPMLTEDNLSDARLAQAFEDNFTGLFRQFAALLGGDLHETAQGGRHYTFPAHPLFKGAWRARLTAENADAAIDETVAWFEARNTPVFSWWTHAGTTPDDFGHRLVAHGFSPWDTRDGLDPALPSIAQGAPIMAADLRHIDESALTKAPPEFRVSQAVSEADLTAFAQVVAAVYLRHPEVGAAWADATRAVGAERAPWKLYLGWLDGVPVATNILTEIGGTVGLWNIGTLPEHRGKGIGAAVTIAPLLDARANGCRYAGLFASPLGAPVYERLGFRFTGTRLNRYMWRGGA